MSLAASLPLLIFTSSAADLHLFLEGNMKEMFKRQDGFSIIGMLISTVVVALMCWFGMKLYFKTTPSGKRVQEALAEQGIKTDNYVEMIESAQEKAKELAEKMKQREQQLQELDKQ